MGKQLYYALVDDPWKRLHAEIIGIFRRMAGRSEYMLTRLPESLSSEENFLIMRRHNLEMRSPQTNN